jgi:resolvase-like protein
MQQPSRPGTPERATSRKLVPKSPFLEELFDLAMRRRVDLIVVWKLDRAFRSVADGASTLQALRSSGCGIRSLQEPWIDTTTAIGEGMYHITLAWAQLEKKQLTERVRAGLERARAEGKCLGQAVADERGDGAPPLAQGAAGAGCRPPQPCRGGEEAGSAQGGADRRPPAVPHRGSAVSGPAGSPRGESWDRSQRRSLGNYLAAGRGRESPAPHPVMGGR